MMKAFFAAIFVLVPLAGPARSSVFEPAGADCSPGLSWLGIQIGGLNVAGGTYARPGTEDAVLLLSNGVGGYNIQVLESGIWSTANIGSGTSLFTGVPLVQNIKLTMRNRVGTFSNEYSHTNYLAWAAPAATHLSPNGRHEVLGPFLGGEMQLEGRVVMTLLNSVAQLSFDLAPIGGPPGVQQRGTGVGGMVLFTMTHGPWVTGSVPITDVTTNVLSVNGVTGVGLTLRVTPHAASAVRTLSTNGGFVSTHGGLPLEAHTVTVRGGNQLLSLNSDASGWVTLVSPMRVSLGGAGTGSSPGAAFLTMRFVPEPGTLILLIAGGAGLLIVARSKMP